MMPTPTQHWVPIRLHNGSLKYLSNVLIKPIASWIMKFELIPFNLYSLMKHTHLHEEGRRKKKSNIHTSYVVNLNEQMVVMGYFVDLIRGVELKYTPKSDAGTEGRGRGRKGG